MRANVRAHTGDRKLKARRARDKHREATGSDSLLENISYSSHSFIVNENESHSNPTRELSNAQGTLEGSASAAWVFVCFSAAGRLLPLQQPHSAIFVVARSMGEAATSVHGLARLTSRRPPLLSSRPLAQLAQQQPPTTLSFLLPRGETDCDATRRIASIHDGRSDRALEPLRSAVTQREKPWPPSHSPSRSHLTDPDAASYNRTGSAGKLLPFFRRRIGSRGLTTSRRKGRQPRRHTRRRGRRSRQPPRVSPSMLLGGGGPQTLFFESVASEAARCRWGSWPNIPWGPEVTKWEHEADAVEERRPRGKGRH
ncbi:hypothetical protein MRX96_021623 [Rhipicephalus microplus]